MKLGIIGSGMIVYDLLTFIDIIDEIELTAILGRKESQEKIETLINKHHIKKAYYDYDELLNDDEIDTIYVALPNHLHYEYTKKALLHNKHVICEKPFTSNVNELDELIEKAKATNEDMFFIILDEITDPHNLGTIIRTADAVGAHGVIIPKRRSVHITPIVAKASAGAIEYMPVCKVTNIVNTIKRLKEEGLWIAAADMDGEVFYEQNLTGPIGLVIGSEGFGISRLVKQNCDFTVKMPMTGNVTSLNASVAGGILLYEIFRQRNRD